MVLAGSFLAFAALLAFAGSALAFATLAFATLAFEQTVTTTFGGCRGKKECRLFPQVGQELVVVTLVVGRGAGRRHHSTRVRRRRRRIHLQNGAVTTHPDCVVGGRKVR